MAVTQEMVDNIKKQLEGLPPEEQQKKLQEILSTLPPEDREQLMGGSQCPFCSIVKGEIKAKIVFEDDKVMAILDINPANKGHILLFPKEHYQFLPQMEDNDIGHLFKVANKLSEIIFKVLEAKGTNILVSNGPAAGQKSPHALVNIIPRFEKDEVAIGWKPKEIKENEMDEIANKITAEAKNLRFAEEKIVIKAEEPKKDFMDDARIP
ncbi:MAG: HIT domain-containing protein [Nanoarchaeota archaeon]|nr:HIT domain-containing protein [Nanoarchaeota archaeon]